VDTDKTMDVCAARGSGGADRPGRATDTCPPGARILVVDNEPGLAELLRAYLELEGHQVSAVATGEAAMALLAERPFDVLLTDLRMPEMSGWELARGARRIRPELPVVIVSGWSDELDRRQMVESGIADAIQKPFALETVQRVVARTLGHVSTAPRGAAARTSEDEPQDGQPPR
jgi:DNA-binding response OmpR family regulator